MFRSFQCDDGRRLRADQGSIAGTRPIRMELQSTERRFPRNALKRIFEVARAQSRKRRRAPGHDPMTDHLAPIHDLLKMLLAGVFGLGYFLGELLAGKSTKLRLLVLLPLSVVFLVWYFFL